MTIQLKEILDAACPRANNKRNAGDSVPYEGEMQNGRTDMGRNHPVRDMGNILFNRNRHSAELSAQQ